MRHCFTAINRSTGQTTHAQKPGLAPLFQAANTRIQMHQNLFTLTKNKSAPRQFSLGTNIRQSAPQTFAGIEAQNYRNSIIPVTAPLQPIRPNQSGQAKHGGDGRNRTDDPLLAKQVLYQLSYIPRFHQTYGGPGRT